MAAQIIAFPKFRIKRLLPGETGDHARLAEILGILNLIRYRQPATIKGGRS